MVGDIGVAAVGDELTLVTRASIVDKGIRISSVKELVADICMTEVVIDTVSSGMSTTLISPSPDPDPTKLVTV